MAGKFELYTDAERYFRFRLKARNGEIVAPSSEAYFTKDDARKGIQAVKDAACDADTDDLTT